MPNQQIQKIDEKTFHEILQLVNELKSEQDNSDEPLSIDEQNKIASQLQGIHKNFLVLHDFKVGSLVIWKDNLKNKRMPKNYEPAIVIEILDNPVFDKEDSGSPYFREPLNMIIGVLGKEDEMLLFHVDSRRFRPFS
jgi:hypothetical protein